MHGHILLERALPLSWTILQADALPLTPDNHLLFSLLDHLDEPASHKAESDTASELLRVEAKLNVIMQLLGQVLQSRQALPPTIAVRFTNETLAWQVGTQTPPVGTGLALTLYPDHTIPLAITFAARVCGVTDGWMEVDMHGLHEDELAIWSRWVFRQHRRQVAQARLTPTAHKHSQ